MYILLCSLKLFMQNAFRVMFYNVLYIFSNEIKPIFFIFLKYLIKVNVNGFQR
ncbi:Uncharacterised protein [Prevotella melaninogenica]|nr:Uncharacterised protein [Prevotella melaninogenica]